MNRVPWMLILQTSKVLSGLRVQLSLVRMHVRAYILKFRSFPNHHTPLEQNVTYGCVRTWVIQKSFISYCGAEFHVNL